MPDLLSVVRRLPLGLCGVVFRHDGVPGRAGLGRAVLLACRAQRLVMVSAGPAVPGAGVHLRRGRGRPGPGMPATASAHGTVEMVRALRGGADAVFLSPAFPTASHPGAPAFGPVRWAAKARGRGAVLALGGVDGVTARRLPRWAVGAGAIGALSR